MIDIKSLRIGSHILVNGKRVCVCGIRRTPNLNNALTIVQYTTKDIVVFGEVPAGSNKVEPIPITPELLEELGFEIKDYGYNEFWWLRSFNLNHKPDSIYWDYDGSISVDCLHELESLYYLIYGVELIKE